MEKRGLAQLGSASGLGPEGHRFKSYSPDQIDMKKVKIYKPTKSSMQAGKRNTKKWVVEFETLDTGINHLMGWETSRDTMSEVRLEFSTKDLAVNYAKKNNFKYYVIEPQKKTIIKKSYADNFIK